jgi:propionyl-CoA synthetase
MGVEPHAEKPGSSTLPLPGYQVDVLDEKGRPLPANTQGHIAIKLPLPPGCLPTLWNDDERFQSAYLNDYPGYYNTADGGHLDEDGYLFIMGRVDDVINVAGHRLSTGEMEEMIGAHPAVAEAAVVGVNDSLKGQMPVGFVVLKDGVAIDDGTLEQELVALVRAGIGAFACLQHVSVVSKLPKTRSGKILRKLIRQLSEQDDVPLPSTIDDPGSLEVIVAALRDQGVGRFARS